MRTRGILLMLSVAAGVAVVLLALPHESEARNYWAVGLPTPYTAGPIQPSTLVSATYYGGANGGPAAGTVTFLQSGVAPVGAAAVVSGNTGQYTIGQFYYGTQISPAATLLVQTDSASWEVMQTTAVQGASATTDATRLLPEDDLGSSYVIATAANFVSYLNPQPGYFTVISIKDGTTIQVTTSGPTSASLAPPGIAGCAAPNTVCAMNGGPFTYTVNRGFALHVETSEGGPTCIIALVSSCPPIDLSGTRIIASTSVAAFGGNYCIDLYDSSCDTINEQIQPDNFAGNTFVMCSAQQSGTGQLDMLKIRTVSGGATINFATPSYSGQTQASIGTSWSTFLFNRDTVITSPPDTKILVFQYLANSNVPARQSATQNPSALLGSFGDPSYVELPAMERVPTDHWFYANPSWDNYLYIGAPSGTVLQLDRTDSANNGAPATALGLTRAIGSSGYNCITPLLGGSGQAGGTYHLRGSSPISAQVLGLAFFTSYFYDTGSLPDIPPPPPPVTPPIASFKENAPNTACGPRPISFRDLSQEGTFPIVSWQWDFGDGSGSTAQDPTHQYAADGQYQVLETVTDESGATDTYALTITSTHGDPCTGPDKPQDDGSVPRAPRDDVDPEIASGDQDSDGIANRDDNCLAVANADQEDLDHDGLGDVCDDDLDGDGAANLADNCPERANAAQTDRDGDRVGDACDIDEDGDGVDNAADNCIDVPNLDQADADRNGAGDACDVARIGAAGSGPSAGAVARDGSGLEAVGAGGGIGTALLWAGIASALVVAGLVAVVLVRRRA